MEPLKGAPAKKGARRVALALADCYTRLTGKLPARPENDPRFEKLVTEVFAALRIRASTETQAKYARENFIRTQGDKGRKIAD